MLTNDDLKTLEGIIYSLEDEKANSLIIYDLKNIYNKCMYKKKLSNKRATDYNKNNKKRRSLTNKLYYYKKTGNSKKVKEILEELKVGVQND